MSGRGQTCFLIESTDNSKMLIDCGATSLQQITRQKVSMSGVDRLLITHFHGDHIGGIPFLLLHLHFMEHRTDSFEILGPVGIADVITRLNEILYPGIEFGFEIKFTEINAISDSKPTVTGPFSIEGVPVSHRPESLGYRINDQSKSKRLFNCDFAFSGDTRWCASLVELYNEVDVGILELSFIEQPAGGSSHLSLPEIIDYRSVLKVNRLYFNHLYDELATQVIETNKTRSIGLPLTDGQTIEF